MFLQNNIINRKSHNRGSLWQHHIMNEFNENFTYNPKFHFYYWRNTQEFGFLMKTETE